MRKIIINIFIIITTYVVPVFYFDINQNDSRIIDSIQLPVFLSIFVGAGLLTYLNHKNKKHALTKKWIWFVFELIGITGLVYSAFVLCLLFVFRKGIGF